MKVDVTGAERWCFLCGTDDTRYKENGFRKEYIEVF